MTRAQAVAALRRALVPAVLAALLTLGLVLGLLLTRAPTYEGRVGLVAVPAAAPVPAATVNTNPEYGSVISLAMPALPEVAVSDPVLQRLGNQVPGIDRTELAEMVAVEVVPSSAVARITVQAETPEATSAVLRAVVDTITGSNLLAPVGTFRVLGDPAGAPTLVRPDLLLAIGLGVTGAVLVGLLTAAAIQLARPRLLTVPEVEHVVGSVASAGVPVVRMDRGRRRLDLLVSHLSGTAAPGHGVVTFPAGPGDDDGLGEAVNERLRERPAGNGRHAAGTLASGTAMVTVRLRRTSADQLTAALLRAEESGHPLRLVVAS